MTRLWPYGNEATDGRVSHPTAACYPIMVREASALRPRISSELDSFSLILEWITKQYVVVSAP
jgi:hypothetical protein